MPGPTLLGYARALARGPALDEQVAALTGAGVLDRYTYCDTIAPARQGPRADPRSMFGEVTRAMRSGDILVVPSLGIFARNRAEIIAGMQGLRLRGVELLSVADEIDTRRPDGDYIFRLGEAMHRAEAIWKRERTANATHAARRSGRTGRRPILSPKREAAARADWLDPSSDKTNKQLAAEHGLSPQRLWAKFGARPMRA